MAKRTCFTSWMKNKTGKRNKKTPILIDEKNGSHKKMFPLASQGFRSMQSLFHNFHMMCACVFVCISNKNQTLIPSHCNQSSERRAVKRS